MTIPHVVIIGGGFAGLYAAKVLGRSPVRITLVDRYNHHLFQPLLYQVATASLSPANIAAPIRRVLRRQRNTTVLLAQAAAINVHQRTVELSDGQLTYDYLILAAGATHSYLGHDEWAKHARGLKTIDDAVEIRRRFLLAFEAAEREPDPVRRSAEVQFVVVGAGPTGVELAGAMIEIARSALPRDFRRVDTTTAKVLLIEAGDRVLPGFPRESSASAQAALEKMGVIVRVNAKVTEIDGGGVNIGVERINAASVFWAAGVAASPLGKSLGAPLDGAGRVIVEPDLSIPGHPEVFVVGDLAASFNKLNGRIVPGVCPAAIQMGEYAAKIVRRRVSGAVGAAAPFKYFDKGTLATIGRNKAVAVLGKFKFSGLLAWLLWALVHVMFLVGFRSRLLVMVEWAWIYVCFDRGARLITGERRGESEGEAPDRGSTRSAI